MSTDDILRERRGAAAVEFAEKYLREVGGDSKTWEVYYVDDRTGETWVMDYPESEQHGGGTPRLVKRPL